MQKKSINLALQGGGSHGAFTWGVLDYFMEDERVSVGGISGTSAATNVHTGKIKVFEREELTADMILASACLPSLYKAVEIDGVPYWDGGYVGNPPLYPLFHSTQSKDIVIVQINPIARNDTPKSAKEIHNRINEISFNSSLLRELRSIEFVQRLSLS